jgi:hypothetical protein
MRLWKASFEDYHFKGCMVGQKSTSEVTKVIKVKMTLWKLSLEDYHWKSGYSDMSSHLEND